MGAYISLPKLERIVAAQLLILSEELLDQDKLEEGIDPFPDLKVQRAKLESEAQILQQKIDDSHAAMRAIYLDKVKGTISEAEYMNLLLQISEEKDDYEKQFAELKEQIGQIDKTLAIHNNRKLLVEQYIGTRHLTKEMVSILIDYILVGKKDPVTKYTPVEIHWNF